MLSLKGEKFSEPLLQVFKLGNYLLDPLSPQTNIQNFGGHIVFEDIILGFGTKSYFLSFHNLLIIQENNQLMLHNIAQFEL